jgi:hypothetical protein
MLSVLSPEGTQFTSKSINFPLKYPDDFIGATTQRKGNYTVMVTSMTDDNTFISSRFEVVSNPFLSMISNFVFNKGIAITFGLMAAIITIIYQIFSQWNQDKSRRSEEKSRWMLGNLKYHNYLHSDSKSICENYFNFPGGTFSEELRYEDISPKKILFHTIIFCGTLMKFQKYTGTYYFDDNVSEQFVLLLQNKILKMISLMIKSDYNVLTEFFDPNSDDMKKGILDSPNFLSYLEKAEGWLKKDEQRRSYYLSHYVFSLTMYLNVNKAMLITYSSASKTKRQVISTFEQFRTLYESYVLELNYEFYGQSTFNYYKPYKSGKFNRKGKLDMA